MLSGTPRLHMQPEFPTDSPGAQQFLWPVTHRSPQLCVAAGGSGDRSSLPSLG